ncbi:MAG: hypothetical protein M1835_005174 [Candelina submexicana]|nr:MAG: hypothetical protein M1835_005174 [Candelina submexicana]
MCCATEFDELPVRHNEDLINAELSTHLPLKADALGLPMWDPHVKAFLLLQAHMDRIDLPISDYVGDQNSVLDQSIRIVQASIDVLTELGYLSSCITMMILLQCIKSARWPQDGPLSIFPNIDVATEKTRISQPNAPFTTLTDLITSPQKALLDTIQTQHHLSANQSTQLSKTLSHLPNLKLTIHNLSALGFSIGLHRLNDATCTNGEYRVYAPKFPKPQFEGFFVVVSTANSDEIVALKRVSWPQVAHDDGAKGMGKGKGEGKGKGKLTARSMIRLETRMEARKVDVLVVSDAYVGLVWRVEGVDVPGAPVVGGEGGKKGKLEGGG